MQVRISRTDFSEMMIEANYPEFFCETTSEIVERSYSADLFLGKGNYKELYFDGVYIGFGDIQLSYDTLLDVQSDLEIVKMHFALSGCTSSMGSHFKKEVEFTGNQHNIFYGNGFEGKSKWSAKNALRKLEICLMPYFFRKYLPSGIAKFDQFATHIEKGIPSLLNEHHLQIAPQMHLLIHEIVSCSRKGKFKRMFLEAKIIELLLLQLEQMNQKNLIENYKLKKTDIDKMHAAKEIMLHNLDQAYSLSKLAQMVGTNEFTLKKGFKEVFGNTVFRFWSISKMEQAKIMLAEKGKTVGEVSTLVGYKNPQHFSNAFKKQFGVVPSYFKK
ncbi:MAG: AraC family transcriptional regulator [Bacteroidota bacterium]